MKDEKERISFTGFLAASIIYFMGAFLNFIDNNAGTAAMFSCLGLSFLCLASTHWTKSKKNK